MLTKNAYNLLFALVNKEGSRSFVDYRGVTINCFVCENYPYNNYGEAFNQIYARGKTDYSSEGLYFGDGTVTPTVSDYKLSGTAIANIINTTSSAFYYNVSNENAELQATLSLKNKNTEAVTIKEIGLFGRFRSTSGGDVVSMIDHTVLPAPITIPAGETKSVTYNIRFTFPTA